MIQESFARLAILNRANGGEVSLRNTLCHSAGLFG
jgi:hypothetical protein